MFSKALLRYGIDVSSETLPPGIFAWHGTAEKAIKVLVSLFSPACRKGDHVCLTFQFVCQNLFDCMCLFLQPICHDGFDPSRRSGQAYGPGEYFGVSSGVSIGYAQGCQRLLVCFILQASNYTHQPGYCYVVNNPVNKSHSFCLPVLVLSHGTVTVKPELKVYKGLSDAGNVAEWMLELSTAGVGLNFSFSFFFE